MKLIKISNTYSLVLFSNHIYMNNMYIKACQLVFNLKTDW